MNDTIIKPKVLITRPSHQQVDFVARCTTHGFEPISLPCMEVMPLECELVADEISSADLVFFTSRNAVEFAHEIRPFPWDGVSVHAIGRATARVLNRLKQPLVQAPVEPYSSEAFVDWLEQQPPVSTAMIIKGAGGRCVIEQHLERNGASVINMAVYKRVIPVVSEAEKQRAFVDTPPDVISVTSDDVLRNLIHIAGPEHTAVLRETQLVVNSNRSAEMAEKLGFDLPAIVAMPPGDDGQMEALLKWKVSFSEV